MTTQIIRFRRGCVVYLSLRSTGKNLTVLMVDLKTQISLRRDKSWTLNQNACGLDLAGRTPRGDAS